MTTARGSTPWSVVGSVAIASMEAVALADQIKISRREQQGKSEEAPQQPEPTKKGAHRKSKRKGHYMGKIKVGMAILLMAHSGLGVVEAEQTGTVFRRRGRSKDLPLLAVRGRP